MRTDLDVSIISPCRNATHLEYFLQGLIEQDHDPSRFEVILVSGPGTEVPTVMARYSVRFSIKHLPVPLDPAFSGHTAGILRNQGAKIASSPTLLFLDSDCIAAPSCVREHAAAQRSRRRLSFCGATHELPAYHQGALRKGWFDSFSGLRERCNMDARQNPGPEGSLPTKTGWDLLYSCNFSLPRMLFLGVGGFDTQGYRCHDMELGCKLARAGCQIEFGLKAEAIHLEHPRTLRQKNLQVLGLRDMIAKYPESAIEIKDRILQVERTRDHIAHESERLFLNITGSMPGFRHGFLWILPDRYDLVEIRARLSDYVIYEISGLGYHRINIRLHRSCWDYAFVLFVANAVPEITIVIPVFNGTKHIDRCMKSLLDQKDHRFEVVVIDDASKDDTVARLMPYASTGKVKIVLNESNKGLSYCLNRALDHCETPYLLHLDSDDWLEPDAVPILLAFLRDNPACDGVYADPIVHGTDGLVRHVTGHDVVNARNHLEYPDYQYPRAYRVKALRNIGGWDRSDAFGGHYYEDRLTLARMAQDHVVRHLAKHIAHVKEANDSLSRGDPERAAAAKLGIAHGYALGQGLDLKTTYDKNFLRVHFHPRSTKERSRERWSLIVPVKNNWEYLEYALNSWYATGLLNNGGEVIVVDDASDRPCPPMLLEEGDNVRVVRNVGPDGSASARNQGAAEARNELLFFSDADHVVPDRILVEHGKILSQGENNVGLAVVFGRKAFPLIEPGVSKVVKERILDMARNRSDFMEIAGQLAVGKAVRIFGPDVGDIYNNLLGISYSDPWSGDWGRFFLKYGWQLEDYRHKWLRFCSGGFSIRRDLFTKSGGFRTDLRSMEDWELGIRLMRAGVHFHYLPGAEPLHLVHPRSACRSDDDRAASAALKSAYPDVLMDLLSQKQFPPGAEYFFSPTLTGTTTLAHEDRLPSIPKNVVVLTFDDGPHPALTVAILDLLGRYGVTATFFVSGERAERYPELVRMIPEKGHEIGVHGWSHQRPGSMTTREIRRGLERTQEMVQDLTGIKPVIARAAYGDHEGGFDAVCKELGLCHVGWDSDSMDWAGDSVWEQIARLSSTGLAGRIHLFHDGCGEPSLTMRTLEWLMATCRTEGLRVSSVAGAKESTSSSREP
jgi:glycosyltransferase involved in cell wall biosynthesis/peptidoglycan/xylan/chitin deacetylase (PgdA/CDA1 family)